jgi:O-antigen/teichoic acid export membrane protein
VVLAFVSPTIQAFFFWQACIGFVYAITMRWAAWRVIGRLKDVQINVNDLKRVWRFSVGMSGVALSAIILMQLDKVLLSRILSLEDFGRYALAGVVASVLYVLLTPTFNVIYPRMSALVATGDTEKLIELYRSGTRLLLAVLFPIATAAAVFSEDFIYLWTGNLELSSSVAPIISLLLVGTSLNGAMHFPYALQLASGMTRLPLMINTILMIALVPMTIFLALRYGAVGGAAAWALLNALYLFVGTWLTHRSFLKGIGSNWILEDVAIPLGLSLLIVGAGGLAAAGRGNHHYMNLLFGSGLAFLAFLATMLVSPHLILVVRKTFSRAT